MEIQSYRDRKHMDDVGAKTRNDASAGQLFRQFTDLITPGSCIEGEFGRLDV